MKIKKNSRKKISGTEKTGKLRTTATEQQK